MRGGLRLMDADALRAAEMAAVGLTVTSGRPALIVEAAVFHLRGARIVAGPFVYWVAPDTSVGEVPVRLWPVVRLAPPWREVAERLMGDVLDRPVVVVHEPERLDILRRHLPDWQPADVLITRDLAKLVWPRLDGYDLDALTARTTADQVTAVGPGAVAEAQAIALLLGALLPAASDPPSRPRDLNRTAKHA
jgi:hypothetical protein